MGWQMFFALLLADVVALVMVKMGVPHIRTVVLVSAVVFVILAAVMVIGSRSRDRIKKREEQATARIAELESQAAEEAKKKDEPAV